MVDCICGHDIYYHEGGNGACGASKFDIAECTCTHFRRADPTPIVTTKEVLEELVNKFSPPLTQSQKEKIEAARPRGKCLRCGEDHLLDLTGVAIHCAAVKQFRFNPDGSVSYIVFNTSQGVDLSSDLQSLNVQLDKLQQRIGTLEWAVNGNRPGVALVSGIDGDTFRQFSEMVKQLKDRIAILERAVHVQAGELVCVCGHGLGDHRSDDGCGQCSCMNFRSI
jgi:hypothetical protein